MTAVPKHLEFEIELQPGEHLSLPPALVNAVGPGRWILTVEPVQEFSQSIRSHDGFLKSYAESDEGLYDDLASG
ncbi:MAG TPA: hypothetical protein VGZ47_23170 [Gemmataceae bacterium]|jgi:hypothetical protein|nr:hypothetical protein [Gemmataceae bacterium]